MALRAARGHSLVHGFLQDPGTGERLDEVLVSVFRAPQSPTGEDGVEFSCHGSPAVARAALRALESAGFLPALPGEFSFRAFLHGKTDLARAEAVQELVLARTDGARTEALRRLEGGLSRRISAAREQLISVLAEVQAGLDYGEDESETDSELDPGPLVRLNGELSTLIESYAAGRLHGEGARVVVAGRPNAGKSSLFNLLLREERSIVAAEPGTTRDWIEARVEVEGMYLRLIDTAGLRATDSGVEAQGVARSRRLAMEAEALIYVVDGTAGLDSEDEVFLSGRIDAIRVWNKVDSPACSPAPDGFIPLSAIEGLGLEALVRSLVEGLRRGFGFGPAAPGAEARILVASERQKRLLEEAREAIESALAGIRTHIPLDALSLDLQAAADALGGITGEITSTEVLEAVFSRFCVGK